MMDFYNVNFLGEIHDRVMTKHIEGNKELEKHFPKTVEHFNQVKELKAKASCSSCEVNRKGKPMLKHFVAEMKAAPSDVQEPILDLLGKRVVLSIGKKWVDVKKNTVTPFDWKDVEVKPPKEVPVPNISVGKDDRPKYIFKNGQGPGDIVMLTAAIRDLHINHPEEYITDVDTSSQHIWEGNPYVEWGKHSLRPNRVKPLDPKDPTVKTIELGYPLIQQSNQGPFHFSEAFTEEIEDSLGIRIKRRIGKGDIHIRPEEEVWGWTERESWFKPYGLDPNMEYWIIDAGHKLDFTAKFWGKAKFQSVVDHYKGKIQFVQIGHEAHIHPKLDGVIDLIGKTDDRQLIRLIWASSGVLTPVSLPMVLAAAIPVKNGTCKGRLERPCVVVAGGREPSGWQAHTNHQFVHTCGALPCCSRGGCWKSRIRPIGDGDEKDVKNMCENVTKDDNGEEVPFCMHMISPEDIIRRIDMYHEFYTDGRIKYTYNQEGK
jgi:hypothetical protein